MTKDQRTYELGNKKVSKLLLKYSAPALIGMVVNSLYNLVDTIFIGQGVGTMAIAAMSVSFPVQLIVMAVATAIGVGAGSLISRCLGKDEQQKAERVAGTSMVTAGILGLTLSFIGIPLIKPILKIFGATEAIIPYASDYLTVILMGSTFFSMAVSTNNLVRAEGNAKVAMWTTVTGTGFNIILDPIFIFTLNMGIKGAATATIISQFLSLCFVMGYFMKKKSILKVSRKDLIPDFSLLPEIISVGSSSFFRTAALSAFAAVLNNSIVHYGTNLHLAVFGVASRLMAFMIMPLFGVVQGLQPIIGFNYGARNMLRVKKSLKLGISVATVISTLSFLLLMFFPGAVISVFNNDPELIKTGIPIIRIVSIFLPVVGFQTIGASLFQAIGKALPALFLALSRQVLLLLPLVLILPIFFGISGIWFAFPISDIVAAIITLIWVVREVKLMNRKIEYSRDEKTPEAV